MQNASPLYPPNLTPPLPKKSYRKQNDPFPNLTTHSHPKQIQNEQFVQFNFLVVGKQVTIDAFLGCVTVYASMQSGNFSTC